MRGRRTLEPLPGAGGPPKATYHDPKTGQEFPGLPVDSYSIWNYTVRRGLAFGPAPAELKAKFVPKRDVELAYIGEGSDLSAGDSAPNSVVQQLLDRIEALEARLSVQTEDGPVEPVQGRLL